MVFASAKLAMAVGVAGDRGVRAGLAFWLPSRGFLGQEFLPDFQETDFLMHFVEKPGSSASRRCGVDHPCRLASKELTNVDPGVRNFGSRHRPG